MEGNRNAPENERRIPLLMTAAVLTVAFTVGFFFTYLLAKSIVYAILGGFILIIVTILVFYVIATKQNK